MSSSRVGLRAVLVLGALSAGANAADEPRESWDAIYIKGQRVGYFHLTVKPVKDRERELIHVLLDETISFKRGTDPVTVEVMYGTIETPEGAVLRLDTRVLASRTEMRTYGDVIDGKMKLILEGTGQRQEQTIAWGPEVRGPYGAEMSMSRKPMQPGETREVKIFIPNINQIGRAKLTAKTVENIQLGGGVKRDLLRVEQAAFLDDKPLVEMTATHWVDASGQILRTSMDVYGGMETYRTTRDAALKNVTHGQFDLTEASMVKVPRQILKPYESRGVVYKLGMRGDEPAKLFPNDRRQTISPGADPAHARLTVSAVGPDDGEQGPEAVDPEYLRANAMVDSKDPNVAALAQRATAGQADPWQKAVAIERWVFENIKKKNYETVFSAAGEVARDLTGDCTEHSVLAAAMCRAVGIPSRVVVGLVYDEPRQGFGYHMWNEVYVNRRWVAIDATFNQSQVDAVHLKLTDSSLEGASPFVPFLAVARLFGKLTIEPVEAR